MTDITKSILTDAITRVSKVQKTIKTPIQLQDKQLEQRIKSFSRSPLINYSVELALEGYSIHESNNGLIICQSCKIIADVNFLNSHEYKKLPMDLHREDCQFKFSHHSSNAYKYPCLTKSQIVFVFEERLSKLRLLSSLPQFTQINEINFQKLYPHSDCRNDCMIQMALCGWEFENETTISCFFCFRLVGLWNFKSETQDILASSHDGQFVLPLFNALSEHRHYCVFACSKQVLHLQTYNILVESLKTNEDFSSDQSKTLSNKVEEAKLLLKQLVHSTE